jgi:hypothetical protein
MAAVLKKAVVMALTLVFGSIIVACSSLPGGQKDNNAAALMPAPAGYSVANTIDIQDTITKIAGAAALGSGQPQFTALVAAANEIAKCYQNAGAIEGRVLTKQTDPTKAGAVIIINRNLVSDPNLFLGCVGLGGSSELAGGQALQPCVDAYTISTGTNEFYVGYVATDVEVCQAVCNNMAGCTKFRTQ